MWGLTYNRRKKSQGREKEEPAPDAPKTESPPGMPEK
jgi:hypothetical protein